MNALYFTLYAWWQEITGRLRLRSEQGDVPGWVLVTLMTAGLVTVLWAVAGSALTSLFEEAISGVKAP